LGEKLAFFSKTHVMIRFLQKATVVWAKHANIFAYFLVENIFKIKTSVPGHPAPHTVRYGCQIGSVQT
jgi:hypothetical protein